MLGVTAPALTRAFWRRAGSAPTKAIVPTADTILITCVLGTRRPRCGAWSGNSRAPSCGTGLTFTRSWNGQRWRRSRWRGGRLACHWVTGTPPEQWERSQRGFLGRVHRPHPGVDSHLGERGCLVIKEAGRVVLTGIVAPQQILRVWGLEAGSQRYSCLIAQQRHNLGLVFEPGADPRRKELLCFLAAASRAVRSRAAQVLSSGLSCKARSRGVLVRRAAPSSLTPGHGGRCHKRPSQARTPYTAHPASSRAKVVEEPEPLV